MRMFQYETSPLSRPSTSTSVQTRTLNIPNRGGGMQILSDATVTHSTDDDFGKGS